MSLEFFKDVKSFSHLLLEELRLYHAVRKVHVLHPRLDMQIQARRASIVVEAGHVEHWRQVWIFG